MHAHAEDNGHEGLTITKLLKWLAIGFLAVLALKIAFGLIGSLIGLALFAVFKLGPLVLVAWLGWKAWQYFTGTGTGNGNGDADVD